MSVTVYILYSVQKDRYYIGFTTDLELRIHEHNSGHTKSTQSGRPWQIVYKKQFDSRSEAVRYENYLKRMKSRRFLQELIESC